MFGKPKRVDFKINSIHLISWHFYVYQMHPLPCDGKFWATCICSVFCVKLHCEARTAFHMMTSRNLMKMCTKETQRLKEAKCQAQDTNKTYMMNANVGLWITNTATNTILTPRIHDKHTYRFYWLCEALRQIDKESLT